MESSGEKASTEGKGKKSAQPKTTESKLGSITGFTKEENNDVTQLYARFKRKDGRGLTGVCFNDIVAIIEEQGFTLNDPRMKIVNEILPKADPKTGDITLPPEQFRRVMEAGGPILLKAIKKQFVIQDFPEFHQLLTYLYLAVTFFRTGSESDTSEKSQGISLCSADLQKCVMGNSSIRFAIEDCSKPFLYGLAVELLGVDMVHSYVGLITTHFPNDSFEMMSINGGNLRKPYNAMEHTGMIVICSLISNVALAHLPPSETFDYILQYIKKLAGTPEGVQYSKTVFMSFKDSICKWLSIAFFMKKYNCLPEGGIPEVDLDLYFQTSAIEVSCEALSLMGATIANNGVNPLTGVRVLSKETSTHVLTMMQMFTLSNRAATWNRQVGQPIVTNSSGACLLLIPGLLAIAFFSPSLSEFGLSIKGHLFMKVFVDEFNLHPFRDLKTRDVEDDDTEDSQDGTECRNACMLFKQAYEGNAFRLSRQPDDEGNLENRLTEVIKAVRVILQPVSMLSEKVKVCEKDYLKRTLLHAAAANGHIVCVKLLCTVCPFIVSHKDCYGWTAKDDAALFGHEEIVEYLNEIKEPINEWRSSRQRKDLEIETVFGLLKTTDGIVPLQLIVKELRDVGLLINRDPRLANFEKKVFEISGENTCYLDLKLPFVQFQKIVSVNRDFLLKALSKKLVIENFPEYCKSIEYLYELQRSNIAGKLCEEIPELGKANPNLWGVAICTIDGQRKFYGDSSAKFIMFNSCKPLIHGLVLRSLGNDIVDSYIDCEPTSSGQDVTQLTKEGKPFNVMVNAGVILLCALLNAITFKGKTASEIHEEYVTYMKEFTGEEYMQFKASLYSSLKDCGDLLRCLAYGIMSDSKVPAGCDIMASLDFFLKACAMEVTCESLSIIAATLANSGTNPLTQKEVLNPAYTKEILSAMYIYGMYNFSGKCAFYVGLPTKCSSSGGLMLIVPGTMGIGLYSPLLNDYGISNRGINFCMDLVKRFKIHPFDNICASVDRRFPSQKIKIAKCEKYCELFSAAAHGDLPYLIKLKAREANFYVRDPVGHTVLHVAVVKGFCDIVKYLVEQYPDLIPLTDKWNRTARMYAQAQKLNECLKALDQGENILNVLRSMRKGGGDDK